jgi:hypothetical protein
MPKHPIQYFLNEGGERQKHKIMEIFKRKRTKGGGNKINKGEA